MFFSKKKHYVKEQIDEYMVNLGKCRDTFREAWNEFLSKGKVTDEYVDWVGKTHKYEGRADDIRDNLETSMYEESLIPESRGDVLAFMENLDFLPNRLESIVKYIDEVNLSVPDLSERDRDMFLRNLKQLMNIVLETYDLAIESGVHFFEDKRKVREYSVAIDRKESEADSIEGTLKKFIFTCSEFRDFDKLLFYELITRLSDVADLAEKFHRRVILLSFKSTY
jgi:predicted phosphate transport protein (TIGR00153 family)